MATLETIDAKQAIRSFVRAWDAHEEAQRKAADQGRQMDLSAFIHAIGRMDVLRVIAGAAPKMSGTEWTIEHWEQLDHGD